MKISEISNAEINIKIEIEVMESLIETTLITVSDAKKLADAGYKILMKCEELRKSRDNWRQKYEELEKEKRGIESLD